MPNKFSLLSLETRTLPEALSHLSQYGTGPMNTVLVDRSMLERFATAARELRNAAESAENS